MKSGFKIGGIFKVECYDKFGVFKWSESTHNLVTNEGLNHALDVLFHGSTAVNPWYIGLKGTGAAAAGDTLVSHSGWSEITAYADNRKEFNEAAASSQSITNSANKAVFTMNDTASVYGLFLCSAASGTTGTLFSVADFSGARSLVSTDVLNVQYTISCADS